MSAQAAALARRLCQFFDSGGESQRSVRARHASAVFQLLNKDTPEYQAEYRKCDADPVGYLEAAERGKCACEVGHDRPYWKCPVHGDVSVS